MPIVIPREGALPSVPDVLTREQKDKLWEAFVVNWIKNHPDEFRQMINEAAENE